VTETMTNVGFGETAVTQRGALVTAGAIVAMLGGIVFTSIFIGYVSSALTRAEWTVTQGLRRIRGHGHVIVCGAGRIGGAVVGILTRAGRRVVVIDPEPGAWLVRRARDRDVDLLTGSATRDDALQLANVHGAAAVLALTDNDTVNLEIALSARAIAPSIPLVVRMEDATFAATTADVFGIQTFSPAALSAPAFAGLARFPGTRGRVRFASEGHTIGQRTQGAVPLPPPVDGSMPLAVWRAGSLRLIREYDQMAPHDVLLFTVALGQHHAVPTTVAGNGYAP
jgi:voltage-gated potassium channel Kch